MDLPPTSHRSPNHRTGLAFFAALGSAWVFVLVTLGAFTTSIGAGMVFPDWPLSNGSLNPHGWLENIAMFAEHSHRLSAGLMSLITIGLALWIWRTDERPWLRRLAWFAVALVLAQALVGGLRVLLDRFHLEAIETSVGRLFAMLHAVLAQLFVCNLIAIAVACTRTWRERAVPMTWRVRRLGLLCCVLLFVQLAIAAVMRHSGAGLAIETFPYSTADGHWLPAAWDFRVGIHFAHRAMAVPLAIALPLFAFAVRGAAGATAAMRAAASALVAFVVLQILLGMQIIYTQRQAEMTTGHVLVGALTLATTFWLTWFAHRDRIEVRHD
ncbi:COX15/CtaA family protein [Opitutus sp. ER46]|uniref:COX15/CtaA family protein n=1 Tax=Opitutus sp. ER46 TaxID=2161864 RepID=UPI000D310629|nr:COX15/CtaA family protein [Opitutus sp. ER46]PTX96377.1 cytochrome oxidase assembly protein [Opitutus sp. ER46]